MDKTYRFLLILFALHSFLAPGSARQVRLFGHQPEYGGERLRYFYLHPISQEKITLAEDQVSPDGSFSTVFDIPSTMRIFLDLDIYRTFVFAEPGGEYRIVLPPRRKTGREDQENPFAQPVYSHLGILNKGPEELNQLIREFDRDYEPVFNRCVFNVYGQFPTSVIDSMLEGLREQYGNFSHAYFSSYRDLKFRYIEFLEYEQRARDISRVPLTDSPPLLYDPAYWEVFNHFFSGIMQRIAGNDERKVLYGRAVGAAGKEEILSLLAGDLELKCTPLLEAVLLKGLFDAYYSRTYPAGKIISLIELIRREGSHPDIQYLAEGVHDKITRMMNGSAAPAFTARDSAGKSIDIHRFTGKYIYLNFCSVHNYSCLRDFEMLSGIGRNFRGVLEVVTLVDQRFLDEALGYAGARSLDWTFLGVEMYADLLERYMVRGIPAYFLIDPSGHLVMSPAPAPADQFDRYFRNLLTEKGISIPGQR